MVRGVYNFSVGDYSPLVGWLDKPLAIPGWSLMSVNVGSVSVTAVSDSSVFRNAQRIFKHSDIRYHILTPDKKTEQFDM